MCHEKRCAHDKQLMLMGMSCCLVMTVVSVERKLMIFGDIATVAFIAIRVTIVITFLMMIAMMMIAFSMIMMVMMMMMMIFLLGPGRNICGEQQSGP